MFVKDTFNLILFKDKLEDWIYGSGSKDGVTIFSVKDGWKEIKYS